MEITWLEVYILHNKLYLYYTTIFSDTFSLNFQLSWMGWSVLKKKKKTCNSVKKIRLGLGYVLATNFIYNFKQTI